MGRVGSRPYSSNLYNYHDKKDPSVSQESSNNDDDFEGLKKDVESLETTIKFPKNRKATGDDNVTD